MAHDEGDAVDDFDRAVGAILKREQKKDGQPSYTELAEITKLGRATIERIMNARRELKIGDIRKVCQALGLEVADVIAEADEDTASSH